MHMVLAHPSHAARSTAERRLPPLQVRLSSTPLFATVLMGRVPISFRGSFSLVLCFFYPVTTTTARLVTGTNRGGRGVLPERFVLKPLSSCKHLALFVGYALCSAFKQPAVETKCARLARCIVRNLCRAKSQSDFFKETCPRKVPVAFRTSA